MAKKNILIRLGMVGGIVLLLSGVMVQAASFKEVPVKGLVNLVDLGSDYCLPCKMMAPVLAKLVDRYKGKAAVVIIDIEKFPDQAKRFGIRVIPTQIFYDKNGQEIFRHEGFMSERDMVAQFKKMGVH